VHLNVSGSALEVKIIFISILNSPTIVRVIKSRRMRWARHVARMGRGEVCTGFWWGNRGKETTGETQCRWKDNIKMDLREVGCAVWTGFGWLRIETGGGALVNAVMNLRVP
jgi:hypothetical protein